MRRPPSPQASDPSAVAWRVGQVKGRPGVRVSRVLEHTAPGTDRAQCGLKASAIVAAHVPPPRLDKAGEATPARARRVCHDRMRPRVHARVPRLVPGVDIGQVPVDAAPLHEERRDHRARSARMHKSGASRRGVSHSCRVASHRRHTGGRPGSSTRIQPHARQTYSVGPHVRDSVCSQRWWPARAGSDDSGAAGGRGDGGPNTRFGLHSSANTAGRLTTTPLLARTAARATGRAASAARRAA